MSGPKTTSAQQLDRLVPLAVGGATAQSLNALAGGIGVLFVLHNSSPDSQLFKTIFYAVILQSITALIISIACRFGKIRSSTRLVGVLIAGTTRGILLWLIVEMTLPNFPISEGIEQVLGSILFTFLWLLTAGHFVQGSRDYRAAFAALFEQALSTSSGDDTNSAAWREANDLASAEQISARSKIEAISTNPDLHERSNISRSMITVANEIHQAALDRVRPASHRMWTAGSKRPPALDVRTIISRALNTWPAPVGVAVSLSAFITGFGAMVSRGPAVGLFTGIVVGLVTSILLATRNQIQVTTRSRKFLSAATLMLIFPVTFISMEALGRLISLPSDLPGIAVVSMAAVMLSFICIALQGIQQHRSDLLSEMRQLLASGFWQSELGRAVEARNATDAATFLHHKVQSQLLAVALQLELAAQSNDNSDLNDTLTKARSILDSSAAHGENKVNGYQSLIDLPSEWEGICAVKFSLPDRTQLADNVWNVIDMSLRELVANAVRSGRANEVVIEVENNQPDQVEVTVKDNGVGPSGGISGLGTTWLNAIAHNLKVTENSVGGTTVTFDFYIGS
jgi:signal transduction histidine kinase